MVCLYRGRACSTDPQRLRREENHHQPRRNLVDLVEAVANFLFYKSLKTRVAPQLRRHTFSKSCPFISSSFVERTLWCNEKIYTASILVSIHTYLQGEVVGEDHGVVEMDDHYNTIVEEVEVRVNHHMYFAVAEKVAFVHMTHYEDSDVWEGMMANEEVIS